MGGGNITVEDRMQEGVSSRLPPTAGGPDSEHTGRFQKVLRILGVEQFFKTIRDRKKRNVAQRRGMNPFDQTDCWSNCRDFWAVPEQMNEESSRSWLESGCRMRGMGFRLGKGGEARLGGEEVDYYQMWEVPERRRKVRRLDEEYEAVGQGDDVV